ncbi:MAG: hypothetical protein AAF982_05625 [Pseudomonadota bacterium]
MPVFVDIALPLPSMSVNLTASVKGAGMELTGTRLIAADRPTVWAALSLMLLGMFLVQPRRARVEEPAAMGDSVR